MSVAKLKSVELESAVDNEQFLAWLLQRQRTERLEEVRAGHIGDELDDDVLPTLMKLLEAAPALKYFQGVGCNIQLNVTKMEALQSLCAQDIGVNGHLPSNLQVLLAGSLQLDSGAYYPHTLQVVQLEYCDVDQLHELFDLPCIEKVRVGELSFGLNCRSAEAPIAPRLEELVIHSMGEPGLYGRYEYARLRDLPNIDVTNVKHFQVGSIKNFKGYPYHPEMGLLGHFGSVDRD